MTADPASKKRTAAITGIFDFGGRYGRKQFWLGALGLVALLIAGLIAASTVMRPTGPRGAEVALTFALAAPFVWFYCKLIVHRLHDLGWSGWWLLLLGPVLIPLPLWMMHETHAVYHRIEQSYAAQQAIKPYVASLQYGALALFVGGFVLMGCLRGTRGPNRYGPDPVSRPPDGIPAP
jgi:uncharacterized membrane protein YhaH (DUF805 family)